MKAADEKGNKEYITEDMDGGFLGSETSGGFLGTYVGMFASRNRAEKFKVF